MKNKGIKIVLNFWLVIFLILGGCKKEKENTDITTNQDTTTIQTEMPQVNQEAIDEIVNSFPMPIEMSAIIKSLNIPFSKRYLLDPDKTEDYDTNNKKAFALGVLSADLGYLNIYGRSTLIVEYLSAIKRLADDLRVGQFFDFQALKRMATNNNIDTLIITSLTNFQSMNQHLSETNRSNLSLLMVTGVWIEGLYLLSEVTETSLKNKNSENFQANYEKLKEFIGQQKTLFLMLYKVLILYKDDPYFEDILKNFDELKSIYDNVTIEIRKTEGGVDTTGGEYVIVPEEESIVKINDEQVEAIISTTKKIRNKLINL